MGKGGWSAPFSKLVHDSWAARSKQVGSAARAEIIKQNILNGATRYQMTQTDTDSDYDVDRILNGWFGEPPKHSDREDDLIQYLYAPLRKMEDELLLLRAQVAKNKE